MNGDQKRQDLVMKPHVHLSMAVPELGCCTFHSTQPIQAEAVVWPWYLSHWSHSGRKSQQMLALVETWYLCVEPLLTLHSCGLLFSAINVCPEERSCCFRMFYLGAGEIA